MRLLRPNFVAINIKTHLDLGFKTTLLLSDVRKPLTRILNSSQPPILSNQMKIHFLFAIAVYSRQVNDIFQDTKLQPLKTPLVIFGQEFIKNEQTNILLLDEEAPGGIYGIRKSGSNDTVFMIGNRKLKTRPLLTTDNKTICTLEKTTRRTHLVYKGQSKEILTTVKKYASWVPSKVEAIVVNKQTGETVKIKIISYFWAPMTGAHIYLQTQNDKVLIGKIQHITVPIEGMMVSPKLFTMKSNYAVSVVAGADVAFMTILAAAFVAYLK